jgi:hypothetical protein
MEDYKFNQLLTVSDPEEAERRANSIYNKPLYLSTRKYKKYMIQDDKGKWRHFGDIRYQDALYHKDQTRINNYWNRMSNIRGNWRNDKYSPNNLSLRILW